MGLETVIIYLETMNLFIFAILLGISSGIGGITRIQNIRKRVGQMNMDDMLLQRFQGTPIQQFSSTAKDFSFK